VSESSAGYERGISVFVPKEARIRRRWEWEHDAIDDPVDATQSGGVTLTIVLEIGTGLA
jgi:hypothetical protein